jgi:hypothetical protein
MDNAIKNTVVAKMIFFIWIFFVSLLKAVLNDYVFYKDDADLKKQNAQHKSTTNK